MTDHTALLSQAESIIADLHAALAEAHAETQYQRDARSAWLRHPWWGAWTLIKSGLRDLHRRPALWVALYRSGRLFG